MPDSENIQNSSKLSPRQIELVRIQAEAEMELRRRFSTFRGFVHEVRPSFQWYKHCDALGQALDRVCYGDLKRLMVFMPPRSGKSEQVGRLYPAYHLFHHPEHHFGITSYAAELAYGLSRDARDNYVATGRGLSDSAEGMVEWHTTAGGRCWSAGVGGPITGKGGDVMLVDDPFKNEEEAYSAAHRQKVWDWYQHTFYTRLHPNAAIIVVLTRWHEDDLSGRLLNDEKESEHPEHWHILNFEAVKQETPQEFPKTCSVSVDWRQPGEALCPERYDSNSLAAIKARVGDRAWHALYQQNPLAEEGNIWKLEWFRPYDDSIFRQNGNSISLTDDGCDWDTAYGDKDEKNAASAFVRAAVGDDGNIYVSDCGFQWLDFPAQIEWMKEFDAPHYVEAKASGKSIVQALNKAGIYAGEVQVKGGDKIARTTIATPIVEQGKVFIHRMIWDQLLFDERQGILGFPSKPFRDLNDAFVQMLHRLWPYTTEEKVPLTDEEQMERNYLQSLAEELPVVPVDDWRDTR